MIKFITFKNIFILLLVFISGFLFSNYNNIPNLSNPSNLDLITGKQEYEYINVIYVGSANCGYCKTDRNKSSVRNIFDTLKNYADTSKHKLIRTGIAPDVLPSKGLEHLWSVGPFDQVISGGRIFNIGLLHTVWSDENITEGTPQILIIKSKYYIRPVKKGIEDVSHEYIILNHLYGVDDIVSYSNNIRSKIDSLKLTKL